MAQPNAEQLSHIVEFLKRERHDMSLQDVMELAEKMALTLDESVSTVDTLLHDELKSIAGEIANLKHEIGTIRPDHVRFDKIPEAGLELDAVVEATESATHTIMESAEKIMAADAADPVAYKTMVDQEIITIFEACTFQDITGQRIRKVVRTLSWIEDRVAMLAQKLKMAGAKIDEEPTEETEDERRMRELILHGPQLAGEGVSQNFVDDVFSSSDQDDIDKLFS